MKDRLQEIINADRALRTSNPYNVSMYCPLGGRDWSCHDCYVICGTSSEVVRGNNPRDAAGCPCVVKGTPAVLRDIERFLEEG